MTPSASNPILNMIDKKDLSFKENSKCLNLGARVRQSGHLENELLAAERL